MFFAFDQVQLSDNPMLRRSMLVDRGRQFVARHQWPLTVDDAGLEVDEYDDWVATYCVVAEARRHLASVRLRPARTGCMVERHFPALWQRELGEGVEITRFCAAPELSPDERLTAVSNLLLGLCRYCQRSRIESFFGVVFPAVARALQQTGWRGEVLNQVRGPKGPLLLTRWTPSDLVAWSIQERRELREEAWARRREEAQAESLVA